MEPAVNTQNQSKSFEPVIVAYCCKWCSYAAADLAGNMRIQYPANVRILRVPCTGRVDVLHLLQAFEYGADGVFISGCLPGDCHYLAGNNKAQHRVDTTKKILADIGVAPERLEMFYNSAAMGPPVCQDLCRFHRSDQGPGARAHVRIEPFGLGQGR